MKAALPTDEAGRLATLRALDILDTAQEAAFDEITRLAAQICRAPIALISLVDESRQWFKSRIGIETQETPREHSFCAHTILAKDEVFEVSDAHADPRFADNPLVTSAPHIRFYAGAPLLARDGHALGTLCVIDRTPRQLSTEQTTALRALSKHVMAQFELRQRARELEREAAERQRAEALGEKSRRALLSVLEDEQRAARDLERREEHFRSLLENAADLITVIDHQGVVSYQSPASLRVLGYTPSELTGRNAFEFIHPEDAGATTAAIERARAIPNTPVATSYRIRHQSGEWRILESLGRYIPGESGTGTLVINSRDITETRQLEEQLRQSQKMDAIGQLAGGVAHDFNNILAVILMQAQLAGMYTSLPADVTESLDQICASAERAANLTRQLLLFSRKQVLQPRELSLNEQVTSIARMLQRIIGEDIRLQLHLDPSALVTRADAGMLDQVLLNLAVNARDAMPGGGRLLIETSQKTVEGNLHSPGPDAVPGNYVVLGVSDTGHGIEPGTVPRIFEPFFTTKEPGKGTGLGLATVFGIVKQHRGWIEVQSEPGKGTSFKIFLPASSAPLENASPSAPDAELRGGTETILLVEDERAVRALTRVLLERQGYHVIEAANGVEALSLWEKHKEKIQLLLTDIVMPEGISGRDLATRLRGENQKLRVIFTSGYSADIAGRELSLQEGQNYIQKPSAPHQLLQIVRHSLDG
jgi:two-component system, cell cycle sensor histidine kinase and response regulator CckA